LSWELTIGPVFPALLQFAVVLGAGVGFPWGFYTMNESLVIGKKSSNAAALDGLQEFANIVAAEMTWNKQG
jgi:hypothetical protein